MFTRRRDFLKTLASVLASTAVLPSARAQGADSFIEVFADEPTATIAPEIYGHFAEHIGGVIYDGIWVGADSKIPNVNGIRKDLLDRLKVIKPSVIRWPGGCFADSYDWKDGIGAAARRPARTNFWEVDGDAKRLNEKGLQIFDSNAFGTDEFMRFCKLAGAEPYLAVNLRGLPALDFDHWVEYCNAPAGLSAWSRLREQNGASDPYNVRYWGVGNESWGCGGNFRPEDYASEFRRFTSWVPGFGQNLQFIASGPDGDDVDWTRRVFAQLLSGERAYRNQHLVGFSVHHYARLNVDALQFQAPEWYAMLADADRMEKIMLDHWSVMGEYDRQHKVKLVVDEYGSWYRQGSEVDITHIFGQQITMRDALVTALTLDCFNRNADKVMMANCAQLVNNLNALFLAHENRFLVTPNYHVFAMYAGHQGAQGVRATFAAPGIGFTYKNKEQSLWGLQGSASRKQDLLTLTVVNPHAEQAREAAIAVRGASVQSVLTTVLANKDIHAHNTFSEPDKVSPEKPVSAKWSRDIVFQFAPASVTKLELRLGSA